MSADDADADLGSLFERVTGETSVTERQREAVSHRVLDRDR